MRRTVCRLLFIGIIPLIFVGLFVLRGCLLDWGGAALKEEKGNVALAYLEPLAKIGDPIAQLILIDLYAYGPADIQKDAVKADYWIERSAWFVKNDPAAQELAIAKSFADGGDGIKKDTAESIKWLRLSAQKGNEEAASLLEKSNTH
jgi:TPR repeat protein